MLTEVTNFYSAVSWGRGEWHHLLPFVVKDPLTLLVGIPLCAVLWSFKETVERPCLPGEEKALPGVRLPASLPVQWGPGCPMLGATEARAHCRLALDVSTYAGSLAFSGVHHSLILPHGQIE